MHDAQNNKRHFLHIIISPDESCQPCEAHITNDKHEFFCRCSTNLIISLSVATRAARHYIFGSAFRAMRSWQKRARDLRVSRMRLRTLVARWLRDMLQKTFDEWKQQRADTRELLTGAERVAEKTLFKATAAGFAAWQDIICAQDHKREVLTRIMLRTQDRAGKTGTPPTFDHAWQWPISDSSSPPPFHGIQCSRLFTRGLRSPRISTAADSRPSEGWPGRSTQRGPLRLQRGRTLASGV